MQALLPGCGQELLYYVQEMFLKLLQVKPLKLGWLVFKWLKLTERKEVYCLQSFFHMCLSTV